ncbi:UNVERIFIED_CONTAM: hypothetical protein Sindi_0150900 [Sesamum indicum]
MGLIERCYKKKEDSSWSGPREEEVAETFQKLSKDHQPQPTTKDHDAPANSETSVAMTEQQIWLAAVGRKNEDRVFGLGSETYVYSRIFTSPLSPPLIPPPLPPNLAMEDRLSCFKTMMTMMGEMWVFSSTATPPPTNPRPQTRTIWSSLTMRG